MNGHDPRPRPSRPAGPAAQPDVRFPADERRFLLRQRGISEGVVAGLEAVGIGSLQALAAIGADGVRRRLHALHGRDVWSNRQRALQAALGAAGAR